MNIRFESPGSCRTVVGTAAVAADPQLTILEADPSFFALLGGISGDAAGDKGSTSGEAAGEAFPVSLRRFLEPALADSLYRAAASGSFRQECRAGILNRGDGTSLRFQAAAFREEGRLFRERYPVYRLMLAGFSEDVEKRRTAGGTPGGTDRPSDRGEQEGETRNKTHIRALAGIFDHVMDIDLRTGRYEMLARAEGTPRDVPQRGDYDAAHRLVAERYVLPPHRETFLDRLCLRNLIATFQRDGRGVEMEYERRDNTGRTVWKSRFVFPYNPGGEPHAIAYVRDITAQKHSELRHRQEEAHYLRALQSVYTDIARVDFRTGQVAVLASQGARVPRAALAYADFLAQWILDTVHPKDRDEVAAFYEFTALRARLTQGEPPELEYRRLGGNGAVRWVAATVLSLSGREEHAILLLRDITQRKEAERDARRLEVRYQVVFRQSCDLVTEIDLDTLECVQTPFAPGVIWSGVSPRPYPEVFAFILSRLYPEDRAEVLRNRGPEALRSLFEAGAQENTCRYRLHGPDGTVWMESRALFLHEDGRSTVFILARDISAQKRLEEARDRDQERFNLALRNTYTEIYEIDLRADKPRLLYSAGETLIPVDGDGRADIYSIASTFIHPDDRDAFLENFISGRLRECFAAGVAEIPEEYRRLGYDGKWHWVQAVVVPLCGEDSCSIDRGLLLVRDVTEKKAQEQRQRVADQYDRALRHIYDALYELNVTQDRYRIVYNVEGKYVMPPKEGILGEAVVSVAESLVHPEDRERFLRFLDLGEIRRDFAGGAEYRWGEFRNLRMDGKLHWAMLTMFPVSSVEGSDEIYLVFVMDIDARKKAEAIAQQNVLLERQRFADERYRIILEQTDTLVFEWSPERGRRYLPPEFRSRFAGEYDGRDLIRIWLDDEVIHPEDTGRLKTFMLEIREKSHTEVTVRLRTAQGGFLWCRVAISCVRAEDGRPLRYIGTLNDVDAATRSVLALKYRAEYDTLTGAYNMQSFYDRAAGMIRGHPERRYFVIRMDIDRFKVINDLHGLEEGDRLLKHIAGLLGERMTAQDVFGRLGGDIFCMCVGWSVERIQEFARELADRLAEYPLPSRIVPSFGVCRVDSAETPVNVLCDWANLALKNVKGNYLTVCAFYDEKLRDRIIGEKTVESEMHAALAGGQFAVYLQPKVDIRSSRVIGAESLVRWIHPRRGVLAPDSFVPLFEKNGFVVRLDEYIWERTCLLLRGWLDRGLEPLPVSVNVSRVHFHDTRLCEKLLALVKKYDLPPRLLELELTESAFFENEEGLQHAIRKLQAHGFLFAMDDFGTGYSSLNMLKGLPLDIVKIDRGFLNEIAATERGKTIIRYSIAMAAALDMQVVAEGVENASQAAFLLEAGCFRAQGYFYSRPVTPEAFEALAFSPEPPFPVSEEIAAFTRNRASL